MTRSSGRTLLVSCAAWLALAYAPASLALQPISGVLIVVNSEDPTSIAIGERYRAARGISSLQVVALSTETARTISRQTFEREIRDALGAWLVERGWVELIHTLVVTKGIPLRVVTERPDGVRLLDGREASVDAELALLFSGRDGEDAFGADPLVNDYFDSPLPFEEFRALHPDAVPRYVVARLTGYTRPDDPVGGVPADIIRLIERAQVPSEPGAFVIDEDPNQLAVRAWGNTELLAPAAASLKQLGLSLVHDRSPTFVGDLPAIAGYASWGSNDLQAGAPPYYGEIDGKLVPGRFAARAIALDFVSTNGRSFDWQAEYGQSLLADWIAMGVGGAAGHVFEPSLGRVARPDVLLPQYARGAPAGEAYFRSLTHLGWVNVYVGDPLMRCDATERSTCAASVPEPSAPLAQVVVVAALAVAACRRHLIAVRPHPAGGRRHPAVSIG